jgi:hypothetical protein
MSQKCVCIEPVQHVLGDGDRFYATYCVEVVFSEVRECGSVLLDLFVSLPAPMRGALEV